MVSSSAITSIVTDRLCGSIPMTTRPGWTIAVLRCSNRCGCRAGRAPLLRAEQTPLEPLPALATPGPRRPCESHTTSRGQPQSERQPERLDRASPGTSPEVNATSSRLPRTGCCGASGPGGRMLGHDTHTGVPTHPHDRREVAGRSAAAGGRGVPRPVPGRDAPPRGVGPARLPDLDHHRVVALLERLSIVVPRELGQILRVEPDGDRDVLLVRIELVPDLLTQEAEELGLDGAQAAVAVGLLEPAVGARRRDLDALHHECLENRQDAEDLRPAGDVASV